MRRTSGTRLQRFADRGSDLVVTDPARRPGTRLVIQPVHAITGEPLAPYPGGVRTDTQLDRDLLVGQPVRRSENNPRSHHERLWRA